MGVGVEWRGDMGAVETSVVVQHVAKRKLREKNNKSTDLMLVYVFM